MGALAYMWRRLRSLAGRQELEGRLDDEIRFHVEQQIEKNRRAGMAPDEARRQALIRFGGVEQMREGTRDQFRSFSIEHLARDIRYGLRSLRRHPAFSAMAVLSLAIGIGANAAIFGVVHAVLFRDSPLVQPETLVNIYETEGGRSGSVRCRTRTSRTCAGVRPMSSAASRRRHSPSRRSIATARRRWSWARQ